MAETLAEIDFAIGQARRAEEAPIARRLYEKAFRRFSEKLPADVRAKINGSASPDWESPRTFSHPVNAESPRYRTEDPDQVLEALGELESIQGALPKIALWLSDRSARVGIVDSVKVIEMFRLAIARICEAKNPRLEALLISLALGMNLHGNANGYAIAAHFNLKPQTIHEMLSETCAALGLPKPLSKVNKSRYSDTQYRHNLRKKS